MAEFNASFSLFASKEKTKETQPDHQGNIEILADEVQAMISYLQTAEREQDWKGNSVVKIRIASWNSESKNGLQYQRGKVSPPITPAATPTQPEACGLRPPAAVAAGDNGLPF